MLPVVLVEFEVRATATASAPEGAARGALSREKVPGDNVRIAEGDSVAEEEVEVLICAAATATRNSRGSKLWDGERTIADAQVATRGDVKIGWWRSGAKLGSRMKSVDLRSPRRSRTSGGPGSW